MSFSSNICEVSWDPYLNNNPAAATGVLIPQARPRTALCGIKQYCTFFSSQSGGNVMITSSGSQSAARMTTSTVPLVIYLSISLTPFLTCLSGPNCWISSHIFLVSLGSAKGSGFICLLYLLSFFLISSFSAASNMLINSFYISFSLLPGCCSVIYYNYNFTYATIIIEYY